MIFFVQSASEAQEANQKSSGLEATTLYYKKYDWNPYPYTITTDFFLCKVIIIYEFIMPYNF